MEILLTGFTAFLTQEWIETAFPDDHVLTTHAKGEALLDTRIKTVMLESKQLLDQLAETYQFDRVVYFSEYLLPHGNQEGELDRLRRVLQSCREREVELLYLSGPEAALTPSSGKTLLANAAEELCFHYAKTSKLQVKVFRLPYLYAVSASGAEQFARLFEQISAGTVQMDEQAAQPLLALCAEELADLVARVFDTWTPKPERFTLPDVFGNTQEQLGEVLQKLQPGLKVLYGTGAAGAYYRHGRAVPDDRFPAYVRRADRHSLRPQCRCAVCCVGICFSGNGLSTAGHYPDAAVLCACQLVGVHCIFCGGSVLRVCAAA